MGESNLIIDLGYVRPSRKAVGKFERAIILQVSDYFRQLDYQVLSHARLNVAWSGIRSDIDVLLVKDNLVTAIEVKSHRDQISRARKQILAVSDYIDYGYVATDKRPKLWNDPAIGLLLTSAKGVECIKPAFRFVGRPTFESLFALKKDSLVRLTGGGRTNALKYELAVQACLRGTASSLRKSLKRTVINGE